ncbi:hypothetical protein PQ478_09765 [Alkalihalophilus pseudofirmus]|uniref:hypothetical protein n=1 Tax=Alkalihalophilus pseudofirmus TaxID=79885 RepID=UPI00259B038D|nr:hypothetical protein [Alkalihalophilus pseudofirmus]WEG18750.1 hypothetical protein PQ478_09765 [Alkalihalophilus pseudofirmus]
MNNKPYSEEELRRLLKEKQTMQLPETARHKSLNAFKAGLTNNGSYSQKSHYHQRKRRHLLGALATVSAAGIAGILLVNALFLPEVSNEPLPDVTEVGFIGAGETIEAGEIEENENLIYRILNRTSFAEFEEINRFNFRSVYNDTFQLYLPPRWTTEETKEDVADSILISGPDGEKLNMIVFNERVTDQQFKVEVDRVISEIPYSEVTEVPVERVISEIRMNHDFPLPYNDVFSFDREKTKMYAFVDQENELLTELYVTEDLFGQQMIYTAEMPLYNKENWFVSWILFSHLRVQAPHTHFGSEEELHPEYERPLEKIVSLDVGAIGVEDVEVELYINEDLELTSYLPRGTNIEKIEHEHFFEWRFTEDGVSENSFYAFGKLKADFPFQRSMQTMFGSFDIDLSYYEDLGGGTPYHYGYYSGMEEAFNPETHIDGYITLFEGADGWYYKHKHADREDYNGGVYTQRLNMFIESLEWHE